jgi:chromosome segregation ATPase
MTARPDVTLESIAAELCALPPTDFIAARDARAQVLGDAVLAKGVKALRKPLLAAWVVNLFARERAAALGEALDLAVELREAQQGLDAAALRMLNVQRRALVRSLAQQASALAGTRGEKVTRATTDAVEQTLNAAMFHADAAVAVASGRLLRPLEASSGDVTDAVAGRLDLDSNMERATVPDDELKSRRERKAAEALERNWLSAAEKADRLRSRIGELESELERVRDQVKHQVEERDRLGQRRSHARERIEESQRAVKAAQAALDAGAGSAS